MSKLFLILVSGIEKWEEAITLAHECLEILQKIYGKFHPNFSYILVSICDLLIGMNGGNNEYKKNFLKETLKCLKITHGSDHLFYRQVHQQLHEIL